ncbi:YafY family protein [Cellulomonas sp. PhB143]|uniref:helix-turn-helix transcriptional regulator n=1 Tax=Cellulomonas sp. PhB143 TaxID=2485186 RepID=UPI000F475CEF|nr:WYL domain-containing protein [Cellulomonas sp. PhB143]ROS74478.1 proteasome accessory factor C [Cellulomonas sp. PhB143]
MAERADDRVVRLLGLVAYLDHAGPVSVEQLATRFGVSSEQIVKDVDALWVTGTPGYFPDDLIDFDAYSLDEGIVRLTAARGLTRPLRLGTREAIALIAALRAMGDALAPDDERAHVLGSVLAKLTAATGEAAAALDVRLATPGAPDVVATLARAIADRRRVRIRYVTAADVASERDVDPVVLHTQDEHAYLAAWCHRAGARRTFRVDRITAATALDVPAEEHDIPLDVEYAPSQDAPLATITFSGPARWVAEQVPVESVRDLDDGGFEVVLRVTNPTWLRHLLLEQATYVRGVSPSGLVQDVASAARAALAAYGEPTAP